jgi:hypothetical protein
MVGYVVFLCDGLFYKVRARRTVSGYIRKGRELPLFTATSNAEQIDVEEYNEYRKIGVHVFCQVEECEIPRPATEEVAAV